MNRSAHCLAIGVLLLFAVFSTAGCAPPFPKETLDKVNRSVSFQELKKEPEKFKGTWVLFGGMIGPFARLAFSEGVLPMEVAFWRAVLAWIFFGS